MAHLLGSVADSRSILPIRASRDRTLASNIKPCGLASTEDVIYKFPLVCAVHLTEDTELALETNEPRALLVHTALLSPKTTRSTQGVQVMNIKPKYRLEKVLPAAECGIVNGARYRTRTIPAAGALLKPEDSEEKQLELL